MPKSVLRTVEDVSSRRRWRPVFCNLSKPAADNLDAISVAMHYPRRSVIHSEGQPCRGVFLVSAGRIKLSAISSDGRAVIIRFAGPGDILGLPETVAGRTYETWATASESCEVDFIKRTDFLDLLNNHQNLAGEVLRALSDSYLSLIDSVRIRALIPTASKKLARFLLIWCEAGSNRGSSIRLTLTHEEIGQAIGSTRETVTRLLSIFKRKHLIELEHSLLLITDSPALRIHANSGV